LLTRRSLGLLSQVIVGTMEGNHIGRQDAGGSGGLIEYDIPVSGARNGAHTPDNGAIGCAFPP